MDNNKQQKEIESRLVNSLIGESGLSKSTVTIAVIELLSKSKPGFRNALKLLLLRYSDGEITTQVIKKLFK